MADLPFVPGFIPGYEENKAKRKPCDASISRLESAKKSSISLVMRNKNFSECRMLNDNESLLLRFKRDEHTLREKGLTTKNISDAFYNLIEAARIVTEKEWLRVHGTKKPEDVTFQSSGAYVVTSENNSSIKTSLKTEKAQVRHDFMVHVLNQMKSYALAVPPWNGENFLDSIPNIHPKWSLSRREYSRILTEYGNFGVFEVTWGGSQICPFHPHGAEYRGYDYGSHDYLFIKFGKDDQETGRFFLSELSLHMIEKHGFFGGRPPYRVDPLKAVEFFELGPDKLSLELMQLKLRD